MHLKVVSSQRWFCSEVYQITLNKSLQLIHANWRIDSCHPNEVESLSLFCALYSVRTAYTVSLHIYAQSISSQIKIKEGDAAIVIHVLH